jgi:hypothetical protein
MSAAPLINARRRHHLGYASSGKQGDAMSTRTTETTVTFCHSFTLSSVDGVQPAGTYRVSVDEEEIEGLSFRVFQRVATTLHLPANPAPGRTRELVHVDPQELAGALAADAG